MGKNWEIGIDTYIPLCIKQVTNVHRASLVAQSVKNLPAMQEARVQSLGQEDPLEKEMTTTPVFLPGKSRGWRSLAGYDPRGHKESDMTE